MCEGYGYRVRIAHLCHVPMEFVAIGIGLRTGVGRGLGSKFRRVAESERKQETAGVYYYVRLERLNMSRRR